MSDDLIEATWMQFVIEMDKRLESVERILDAAKNDGVSIDGMRRLFSLFRSIEGLSKSAWLLAAELRFYSTQELLVDVLLDEKVMLDSSAVCSLLDLVDEMKTLHEKANIDYADVHPALMGRVYGFLAAHGMQASDETGAAGS